MIKNPRDKEQEGNNASSDHKKASIGTSSGALWSSGLKNPRIVRVSRAFGGKDRHSKVSTIRGLRDRRVRLSVPTAIQLYDLQDRLGVNQPSKVVDWLLNAAQQEIDKLPPLHQIPPSLHQIPQSLLPQSSTHHDYSPAIENFRYTNNDVKSNNINEGLTALFPQSTYSPYYHWEAATSNAYLSQLGNRSSYQPEGGPHMSLARPESQQYPPAVVFPSYVQMQMALQTPKSNDKSDHLQLGGPSVRHFQ